MILSQFFKKSQILILDFKPLGRIMMKGTYKRLTLKSADKATKAGRFTGFGLIQKFSNSFIFLKFYDNLYKRLILAEYKR